MRQQPVLVTAAAELFVSGHELANDSWVGVQQYKVVHYPFAS